MLATAFPLAYWKVKKDRAVREDFEIARKALYEARAYEAHIYSAGLYLESVDLFKSAMKAWNLENERFFLRRDYDHARALAEQSAVIAGDAKSRALHDSRNLPGRIQRGQTRLKSKIGKDYELLSILPIRDQARSRLSHGMLKLAESEAALQRGQYLQSWGKLEEAEKSIQAALDHADRFLESYFNDYEKWQAWIEQSLQYSIQLNTAVIVIDKIGRRASVYRNGQLSHSFPIEMGENWIGDKQFMGDKATPEGQYFVVMKKQQSQTRYHKALLLDYPNSEDVRRFRRNIQRGIIPHGTEIGGYIEIHGMGGRGVNWTDGCIALNNQDMDMLYFMAREGTPVTIVGSTRPLAEVWK